MLEASTCPSESGAMASKSDLTSLSPKVLWSKPIRRSNRLACADLIDRRNSTDALSRRRH
eukprot:SAG11_NODE_14050_length_627_cov_1.079545_1_plen_59_part_01